MGDRGALKRAATATGTASTSNNAILYESSDLLSYDVHVFQGIDVQAADVNVSLDGTNWSGAVQLEETDGTTAGNDIQPNEVCVLRLKIKGLRVRNKGGTTSANVSVIHY